MPLVELTAYKTTDGLLFTDKYKANCHQKDLDFTKALIDLVEGDGSFTGITNDDVVQFIKDNQDKLRELLEAARLGLAK